jgi:cell division protein FtsQ
MKKLKKLIPSILLVLGLGTGGFILLASNVIQKSRRCTGLEIDIYHDKDIELIKATDIRNWATQYGHEKLEGRVLDRIDLLNIEKRIKRAGYAKNCEASFDVQGKVNIKVEAYQPIARILRGSRNMDRYVDVEGNVFPVSQHKSTKVFLLSGAYFEENRAINKKKLEAFMPFLQFVAEDEFWSSQITEIYIDKNAEIEFSTFMGDHLVKLGKPEKVQSKLGKLMVFYKKILPMSQWSSYKTIDLKYDSQIVCI